MQSKGITRRSFLKGTGALVAALPILKDAEAVAAQEVAQETEEVVPLAVAPPAHLIEEPPVGSFFYGIPHFVRWGDLSPHVQETFSTADMLGRKGAIHVGLGDDLRLDMDTGEGMTFHAMQYGVLNANPDGVFRTTYHPFTRKAQWDRYLSKYPEKYPPNDWRD